jgi:hypothetical protein
MRPSEVEAMLFLSCHAAFRAASREACSRHGRRQAEDKELSYVRYLSTKKSHKTKIFYNQQLSSGGFEIIDERSLKINGLATFAS